MIQRVQSLFLLSATVCQIVLYFTALATFTSFDTVYNLSLFGFYKLTANGNVQLLNAYALFFINILVIALAVYTIFVYKNRKKQIKLASLNILLVCFFVVLIFYHFENAKTLLLANQSNTDSAILPETTYGLGVIMPVISIIFHLLAIRGIRKDEALVRSADRIR